MIVQVRITREEIEKYLLDSAAAKVGMVCATSIEYFKASRHEKDEEVYMPFTYAVVVVTSD